MATTDGGIYISEIVIDSAEIAPKTVAVGELYTITVTLHEAWRLLEPEWFYSGEIYAGEGV